MEPERESTTEMAAPPASPRYGRWKSHGAAISVVLSLSGSTLTGFSAYDTGSGELALTGSLAAGGRIQLSERSGGKEVSTLAGSCAPDTGAISGTMTMAGGSRRQAKPFVLWPGVARGTPLVQRIQRFGEIVEDAPSCSWDVRSPAVFGLGDAARAARINALVRVRFPGSDEAAMVRDVKSCPPRTDRRVGGWYSFEADTQGVLAFVENGYTYFGPAVHGDFNAAAAAVSVDVPTGRKLALADLVTSSAALRPLVTACAKLAGEKLKGDPWWFERDIHGVPSDKSGEPADIGSPTFDPRSIREPSFLVLPDGIAVLIRNQPTVSAFLELQGPVIRWGALLREGVLAPRSIVARLWAREKPLAPGEPPCVRMFAPRWIKHGKGR